METTGRARIRVLIIVLVGLAGLSIFLWFRSKRSPIEQISDVSRAPAAPVASASPSFSPSAEASPTPSVEIPQSEPGLSLTNNPPASADSSSSFVGKLKVVIPVAGVNPAQLLDTFSDARSEGRAHDAIDIPASAGTPVLAAIDGEIVKLSQSERGGTTIYQLGPDKKLVFYYAHLQRYAEGLYVGKFVRQGEVIAYVGDTGNAGPGNYHLHFSISVISDPKRYWEGSNLNPYPLLRQ